MRQQDVLASICKYVNNLYPNYDILTSRNLREVKANQLARERIDQYFDIFLYRRMNIAIGTRGFIDHDRWTICYFGTKEEEVREVITSIGTLLSDDSVMPTYLYNFNFPEVRMTLVNEDTPSNGVITPGQYNISVEGLRYSRGVEHKTLLSLPQTITVPENNYIVMQFPKLPVYKTVFKRYNIYVESDEGFRGLATVVHRDATCNEVVIIRSLSVDDSDALYVMSGESLIPYRSSQVMGVSGEIDENALEDGFWSGYLMIELHSPGMARDPNDMVVGSIGIGIDIN